MKIVFRIETQLYVDRYLVKFYPFYVRTQCFLIIPDFIYIFLVARVIINTIVIQYRIRSNIYINKMIYVPLVKRNVSDCFENKQT